MIHVEIANGREETRMKGSEIVVYTECGTIMKNLFKILKEHHGEEQAKEMIHHLAKAAVLSDEEVKNKINDLKAKNPHLMELSDAVFLHLF